MSSWATFALSTGVLSCSSKTPRANFLGASLYICTSNQHNMTTFAYFFLFYSGFILFYWHIHGCDTIDDVISACNDALMCTVHYAHLRLLSSERPLLPNDALLLQRFMLLPNWHPDAATDLYPLTPRSLSSSCWWLSVDRLWKQLVLLSYKVIRHHDAILQ